MHAFWPTMTNNVSLIDKTKTTLHDTEYTLCLLTSRTKCAMLKDNKLKYIYMTFTKWQCSEMACMQVGMCSLATIWFYLKCSATNMAYVYAHTCSCSQSFTHHQYIFEHWTMRFMCACRDKDLSYIELFCLSIYKKLNLELHYSVFII